MIIIRKWDKILSMREIVNFDDLFKVKTQNEIAKGIAERVKQRRKENKLTQEALSRKSGVSYGSVKRFETKGEISLSSLINIAIALECEEDFEKIFEKKKYKSIQEVIDEWD